MVTHDSRSGVRMVVEAAEEAGQCEEALWVGRPAVVFPGLTLHSLLDIDRLLNTLQVRMADGQLH